MKIDLGLDWACFKNYLDAKRVQYRASSEENIAYEAWAFVEGGGYFVKVPEASRADFEAYMGIG